MRFWNAEFAGQPRFAGATEASLAARLREPGELWLAVDGEIAGVAHGGVSAEADCRRRVPDWPGGTQGYVALLAVARASRRQGVGTELWRRVRESLAGTAQVVIDGDGRNPWWSKPPVFGAPWGPAVAWGDSATRKFLSMRGYGARARAVEFEEGVVVPDAEPERYAELVKGGIRRLAEWALY